MTLPKIQPRKIGISINCFPNEDCRNIAPGTLQLNLQHPLSPSRSLVLQEKESLRNFITAYGSHCPNDPNGDVLVNFTSAYDACQFIRTLGKHVKIDHWEYLDTRNGALRQRTNKGVEGIEDKICAAFEQSERKIHTNRRSAIDPDSFRENRGSGSYRG